MYEHVIRFKSRAGPAAYGSSPAAPRCPQRAPALRYSVFDQTWNIAVCQSTR